MKTQLEDSKKIILTEQTDRRDWKLISARRSEQSMSDLIGGFISAPIKLAAIINKRRAAQEQQAKGPQLTSLLANELRLLASATSSLLPNKLAHFQLCSAPNLAIHLLLLLLITMPQQLNANLIISSNRQQDLLRHKTHYMNIIPSTSFKYDEGRQVSGSDRVQQRSLDVEDQQQVASAPVSHIYKRSSALISSPMGPHYPQLVSSSMQQALKPLSRRMMSEAGHSRWLVPQRMGVGEQLAPEEQQLAELLSLHLAEQQSQASTADGSGQSTTGKPGKRREHEEAELLKQKQHIQYHDQWPSMAGKCHKRTLNFCASVLPFNSTTFPNIIGDTNRFEVKRSLPFFGFLAKSSCNKRLDELLCLLLEPPCSPQSGLAIPPCKKFCRLALEGCNEYIPATLAMSSVFDCRQYPDSNDPAVCINLAQGSKCADDEFKCPDKTCIPRKCSHISLSGPTRPNLTHFPIETRRQVTGSATE